MPLRKHREREHFELLRRSTTGLSTNNALKKTRDNERRTAREQTANQTTKRPRGDYDTTPGSSCRSSCTAGSRPRAQDLGSSCTAGGRKRWTQFWPRPPPPCRSSHLKGNEKITPGKTQKIPVRDSEQDTRKKTQVYMYSGDETAAERRSARPRVVENQTGGKKRSTKGLEALSKRLCLSSTVCTYVRQSKQTQNPGCSLLADIPSCISSSIQPQPLG